ncbi:MULTISPECIES: sn-glycerol-3-phosphate ABC transporter ATP-binding protein UgpC [unclassified Roseitalea]|uniref:ABC transporter ATP-binding protein n=1 Tax=unclassified Roseitalea TaxID=2639107 RepID=UPI00273FB4E0|nr:MULTISPECIES: sn-glycerol-3-phosphate ABC transporter ATP-binding protein UgpC [unclassified Roseitalea]
MARLSLTGIRKNFKQVQVLHGVDLQINDREFVVFVGPSGCGKSTLLRLIAGLDPITAGTLHMDGRLMNDVAPHQRGIAMVFQSYALYPHMDVRENMAFGVTIMGLPAAEIAARIDEAARMLQLTELLDRKPRELSGGQRQRVAIARALVRKPQLFLLDEPLSNLDAALRSEVRLEIARLHKQIGGTMIYVTHDQIEAMTLADRIVVMNKGRIEQVGTPRELFETPANTFVAAFIGSPRMALLPVRRQDDGVTLGGGDPVALADLPQGAPQDITIGLRPDAVDIAVGEAGPGFAARAVYTEYLGDDAFTYARLEDGTLAALRTDPNAHIDDGAPLRLRPKPGHVHYFDADNGHRLA